MQTVIKVNSNGSVSITVPSQIIDTSDTALRKYNSYQEAVAAMKAVYDAEVDALSARIAELKNGKENSLQEEIQHAYQEAMQELGRVYNKGIDTVYGYFADKNNQSNGSQMTGTQGQTNGVNAGNGSGANGSGNGSGTNNGTNRIMELRNTPGYQNYVVGTSKTIDGVVGSSVYKKYYSDISAELYFNGHWLEDINAVQWQVQRQTHPLFGYNSFIYDDVALGNRIIYGAFTINFTEPDKLRNVIAESKVESKAGTNTATYEKVSQTVHTTNITINGNSTKLESNPVHATIWSPRFDIDIVFGESDVLQSSVILPKHIILWDCHLMGSQIGMATNDGVLQESYQFLARDFKVIK